MTDKDAKEIFMTVKGRVKRFQLKNIPQRYTSSSIFKGVRRTKSGKYSVEIRNPFDKNRECLGTFQEEIQACLAYEKKFKEFQRIKLRLSKANKGQEEEEDDEALLDVDRSCEEQGKWFCGGKLKTMMMVMIFLLMIILTLGEVIQVQMLNGCCSCRLLMDDKTKR